MKKIFFVIICVILFSLASSVSAHQPRIVKEETTKVNNPEVSQAFYGELKEDPSYFKIESDERFNLYVGLLVPDIKGIDKDVSAEIYYGKNKEEIVAFLDGESSDWPEYHEEFANDNYFWGPEFGANNMEEFTPKGREVRPGTYIIKVFSQDNEGKYVLVVGEKEEFPIEEIISTIKILPGIKSDFFNKSPFSAFFNKIGLYLAIPAFSLILLLFLTIIAIKKIRRRNRYF